VLAAMSSLLTNNIMGSEEEANLSRSVLADCLTDGDMKGVVEEMNRLLASIPYDDFAGAANAAIRRQRLKIPAGEWLYRSTLLAFLRGAGVKVEAEIHSHKGRADMVVTHKGRVWVMELKVARDGDDAAKLADEALAQIVGMGYADRYGDAVLLGMAIDDAERQITEYRTPLTEE
jgi:hypothetical protein